MKSIYTYTHRKASCDLIVLHTFSFFAVAFSDCNLSVLTNYYMPAVSRIVRHGSTSLSVIMHTLIIIYNWPPCGTALALSLLSRLMFAALLWLSQAADLSYAIALSKQLVRFAHRTLLRSCICFERRFYPAIRGTYPNYKSLNSTIVDFPYGNGLRGFIHRIRMWSLMLLRRMKWRLGGVKFRKAFAWDCEVLRYTFIKFSFINPRIFAFGEFGLRPLALPPLLWSLPLALSPANSVFAAKLLPVVRSGLSAVGFAVVQSSCLRISDSTEWFIGFAAGIASGLSYMRLVFVTQCLWRRLNDSFAEWPRLERMLVGSDRVPLLSVFARIYDLSL